jgi:hypothetical protein
MMDKFRKITKIIDKIFDKMDYKFTSGGNQYSNGDPEFDKAKKELKELIKNVL